MNQAAPLLVALRRGLRRPRAGAPVALAIGATLVGAVLTAPHPSAPPTSSAALVVASHESEMRTYVAVGDSITAGMVQESDSLATPGATSWLHGETASRLVRAGGWAIPGRVTGDMRANVSPTTADVLVLLGGTNDLARGLPWAETEANLRAIVATISARKALVVAIPPYDLDPAGRSTFNARLAALAAQSHWRFLDPWTSVTMNGAWVAGASVDGIHPAPAVAAGAGRVISAKAWTVAARRTGP
jgi:acyl-CoA thioesterase I